MHAWCFVCSPSMYEKLFSLLVLRVVVVRSCQPTHTCVPATLVQTIHSITASAKGGFSCRGRDQTNSSFLLSASAIRFSSSKVAWTFFYSFLLFPRHQPAPCFSSVIYASCVAEKNQCKRSNSIITSECPVASRALGEAKKGESPSGRFSSILAFVLFSAGSAERSFDARHAPDRANHLRLAGLSSVRALQTFTLPLRSV